MQPRSPGPAWVLTLLLAGVLIDPGCEDLSPPAASPDVATLVRSWRPARSVAAEPGRPGSPEAKVVVLSIDGLRPDAIELAPAPGLLALAGRGSYSWKARTVDLSLTLPSHAAMVSGFLPSDHGLTHNDFRPGYIAVPTVMSTARNAGKRVVVVVGKDKLFQLIPPDTFDVFVWAPASDDEVVDRAIEETRVGFDLMFVHLPQVDLAGHTQGWMSPAYLEQVVKTDAAVSRLAAALPPEVTLVITADHGGSGTIHWSGLPEDLQIPWIAVGPGIPAGRELIGLIHTVDTAATAAHVLGLTLDPAAIGRPVREAWEQPVQ
jgi:hypothetical protein